jgi:hypothetical protein
MAALKDKFVAKRDKFVKYVEPEKGSELETTLNYELILVPHGLHSCYKPVK